ncbi:hypothetical protein [Photorhabdus sp. RM126S]
MVPFWKIIYKERNVARRKNAGCILSAEESERVARFIRVFDAAV